MPELQMDVAVANRFISSLSKSLQALCHGCMDFDSGIEIVGYINVNIDSGSKVDYVLNEKVLKSTTNSMTFVSNSFLARKEQSKQTRDGACSPISDVIQQPSVMSQYQSRLRGSFHGSHPRGTTPFSHPHRGSQKRAWAAMERDWRISPKKHRDGRFSYPPPHDPVSTAVSTHSTGSQNPADANFKWPQTSTHGSDINSASDQLQINIKKEVCDNDNEKAVSQNDQEQSQTSDQDTNDNLDEVSRVANIRIKKDPDASTSAGDDENHPPDSAGNEQDGDFKDTFLEPSISVDNENKTQSRNQADDDNESSQFDTSQLAAKSSHSAGLDNSEESATPEISAENVTPGDEIPVEYDEAGEEDTYPQSVYSDAGEGSSDAGQFEVIEIDDEDEDVQAMFGGSQRKRSRTGQALPRQCTNTSMPRYSGQAGSSESMQSSFNMSKLHSARPDQTSMLHESSLQCSFCECILETRGMYQKHLNECHREKNALPFTCSMCQKGFFSLTGLRHHIEAHGGRQFVCSVCDARFQHKHNLKRHMGGVHKLRECPSCNATISDGPEYNMHILRCGTGSLFSFKP